MLGEGRICVVMGGCIVSIKMIVYSPVYNCRARGFIKQVDVVGTD